jgi:hypothetical protein
MQELPHLWPISTFHIIFHELGHSTSVRVQLGLDEVYTTDICGIM